MQQQQLGGTMQRHLRALDDSKHTATSSKQPVSHVTGAERSTNRASGPCRPCLPVQLHSQTSALRLQRPLRLARQPQPFQPTCKESSGSQLEVQHTISNTSMLPMIHAQEA